MRSRAEVACLVHAQEVGGAIPLSAPKVRLSIMSYRGSEIARQIIDDIRREERERKLALKERGGSSEFKYSGKQITGSIINAEHTSKNKYEAMLYRRGQENGNSICSNYSKAKKK